MSKRLIRRPDRTLDNMTEDDDPVSSVRASQKIPIEQTSLPVYSETYGQVDFSQDGFNTNAKVASKGRTRKCESPRADSP